MNLTSLVRGLLSITVLGSITGSAVAVPMIVPTTIADYRDDYQTVTPAAGWSYLWNSTDPIGTSADYVPLVWNSNTGFNFYTHSSAIFNPASTSPGYYNRLTATSGHPGGGTAQGGTTFDRYAIASYSIGETGNYLITDSLLSVGSSNGSVSLEVYVNDILQTSAIIGGATSTNFDQNLGELLAGDQLYVAIGPNGTHSNDGFGFDFTLTQLVEVQPIPEPSTALLLGTATLGMLQVIRRKRRKTLQAGQC